MRTMQATIPIEHLALIKRVAYRMLHRVPRSIELDDLLQAGALGYLDAEHRWDRTRGAFTAFAEWRIKGAMHDLVRTMDVLTRAHRDAINRIERARNHAAQRLMREPTLEEVAQEAGVSADDLAMLDTNPEFVDLDVAADVADEDARNWSERFERMLDFGRVRTLIETLDERARLILRRYFCDEQLQSQIAAVLHIHESRVSQIRNTSLRLLAKRLQP